MIWEREDNQIKLSKEKMLRTADRVLKRTEAYQKMRELGMEENYKILYMLSKETNPSIDNVIAFAGDGEDVISFHPFKEGMLINNWDFNYDDDLFKYLETGYKLVYITPECHYDVWCTIDAWHDGNIDNVKGMQKYLGYCKRNCITKERMESEMEYLDMDVMSLYDSRAAVDGKR